MKMEEQELILLEEAAVEEEELKLWLLEHLSELLQRQNHEKQLLHCAKIQTEQEHMSVLFVQEYRQRNHLHRLAIDRYR